MGYSHLEGQNSFIRGGDKMSIKKLEEYRDMFISDEDITDVYISNFMSEMIDTFKDQSDMIAGLRQEIAKIWEVKNEKF